MQDLEKVKCVMLGDDGVGKTSFLITYTVHDFPRTHLPMVLDQWTSNVMIDDRPLTLELWDTSGNDEYARLRPLCFESTDVFILSYCPSIPQSFVNLKEKYYPEAMLHWPNAQTVLLALKTDLLRDVATNADLVRRNLSPISNEEALEFSRSIGSYKFMQCSSLEETTKLQEIVKEFVRAKHPLPPKSKSRCIIL